jgi:hypothetical protein
MPGASPRVFSIGCITSFILPSLIRFGCVPDVLCVSTIRLGRINRVPPSCPAEVAIRYHALSPRQTAPHDPIRGMITLHSQRPGFLAIRFDLYRGGSPLRANSRHQRRLVRQHPHGGMHRTAPAHHHGCPFCLFCLLSAYYQGRTPRSD